MIADLKDIGIRIRRKKVKYSNMCLNNLAVYNVFYDLYKILTLFYKPIIRPVVLYGCEAWSLTLRVERRLRVFENKILRRIFGLKRGANSEWGRLHNEELYTLYRSPNIVRVINSRRPRWAG